MNDRTTLRTDLNVFADFNPKLPESYRHAPYLILGNIQPALQRSVREQMNGLRLAGGDTMNYWIKDYREELLETIRDWDFLLINDSEARMLSGEYNLKRAAAKILEMGPHTLVIKRGEYGAILFRRDWHFIVPGYLLEEVFDPTGAGDCFAGGFIGYLAEQGFDLKNGHIDAKELQPRRDLWLGHGQLLLREVRRGPVPDPDPRRNRRALPGVPGPSPSFEKRASRTLRWCLVALCGPQCRGDRAGKSFRLDVVLRRRRGAPEHRAAHNRFAHARLRPDRHGLASAAAPA